MKNIINKIRAYYIYTILQLQARFIYTSLKLINDSIYSSHWKEEDLDKVRDIYISRRAH